MAHKSTEDTLRHIEAVQGNLQLVGTRLAIRSHNHDSSKLQEPELSGYAGLSDALAGLQYGTPEHRAAFAPYKEIIRHHYEHNSHHPEHYPARGIAGMSLLDIVEMFCDWKAANDRSGGDFAESIQISIKRFEIDEQLASILENTRVELGW